MLLSTTENKIKLGIFLKPFTREIWYLNGVFVIICIFMMRLIMRREESSRSEKYSGAMVLAIGIVAQQGEIHDSEIQFK